MSNIEAQIHVSMAMCDECNLEKQSQFHDAVRQHNYFRFKGLWKKTPTLDRDERSQFTGLRPEDLVTRHQILNRGNAESTILQNEANSTIGNMNGIVYLITVYANREPWTPDKNEANSRPIRQ